MKLWVLQSTSSDIEMSSQRGENEIRDHKKVGYYVGRVKTVASKLKREKRNSARKQSCRCHLHPSHERLVT